MKHMDLYRNFKDGIWQVYYTFDNSGVVWERRENNRYAKVGFIFDKKNKIVKRYDQL